MRLIKKIVSLRYEKLNDSRLANMFCTLSGSKNQSAWTITMTDGKFNHVKKLDWNRFLLERDDKKYFVIILPSGEIALRAV